MARGGPASGDVGREVRNKRQEKICSSSPIKRGMKPRKKVLKTGGDYHRVKELLKAMKGPETQPPILSLKRKRRLRRGADVRGKKVAIQKGS